MLHQKISRIVLLLLSAISIFFMAYFFFGPVVEGTAGTSYSEPTITESSIIWAYILLAIAAVLAIAFPIVQTIMNPKNAKGALLSVALMATIGLISYFAASDKLLNIDYYLVDNVPSTLKWSEAGIYAVYILLGVAFASIIYSEISKIFK